MATMVIRRNWLSPIHRATLGSVMTGVFGQVAVLVSGVLVARLLGVTDRGYLALLALIPTIITQLGGLGLPLATTYFVARDRRHAAAVVRSIRPVALAQSGALLLLHLLILWWILGDEPGPVRLAGVFTLAVVPATFAQQYGLAILQGQARFRPFNALRLAPVIVYTVMVVVMFLFRDAGLPAITAVWVASNTLVGAVTLVVGLRAVPRISEPASPPSRGQMLRFGAKGFLGSVSPVETFRLDQAVVGLFLTPAALGLYVVGQAFSNLPRLVAQSTGVVAYPHVASQPDAAAARRKVWQFFWFVAVACTLIVVVLEGTVGWLIPFFFGADFDAAVPLARLLLLSALFLSLRRVLADGASGAGHPALATVAEAISWCVLLPALALLMPRWGVDGVAMALVISSALSLAMLVILLLAGTPHAAPQPLLARGATSIRQLLSGRTPAAIAVCLTIATAPFLGFGAALFNAQFRLSTDAALAMATLACAALPLARRILTRSVDIFEPIIGASVTLAVLFGIRPLSMMIVEDNMIYYNSYDIQPYFTRAIVLGLIGTIAFVISYECISFRYRARPMPPHESQSFYESTVFFYIIAVSTLGLFAFALFLSSGGSIFVTLRLMMAGRSPDIVQHTGYSSEYLSSAPILTSCAAVVLITAYGRALSKWHMVLVAAMVLYPVVMFMIMGSRRFVIPAIAIPIVVYYLVHQRRPSARVLMIAVPLVFVILATIPFARGRGAREQVGGATPIYLEALSAPLDSWKKFITTWDTEMIAALAVEVELLREPRDFYYGKAVIGDVILAPIPSAVFPSKPTTARDALLIEAFGYPCIEGRLCPDFSVIGTFYQDFWYPGVIVGMGLFGAASSLLWRSYLIRGDLYLLISVACWTIFLPVIIRAGFMPAFAWMLYFLIPSLLGVKLTRFTSGEIGRKRMPGYGFRFRNYTSGS